MYFLDRIKLNVIGQRNWWFTLSGALLLAGLIALGTRGLNLGIDFKGGTILQRTFTQKVTVAQVRQALNRASASGLKLGESQIQSAAGNTVIIRTRDLSPEEERQVDAALQEAVGQIDLTKNQTDTVRPVIGRELTQNAFWAVVVASILMLLYITLRFEFKFGVAAIVALLHDVFMIMGLFALTGKQVDSPFVAAILTIIGYSINDTIVIFDRIRENLRFHRKVESYAQLVNDSINQTLARSINTVGTTLVSIIALYFFGGESIKTFTFALLFGILSGCYSSIFIASPLWVVWKEWEERRKAARPAGAGGRKRLAEAKAR
ncbi:MAG: protein translocase subunit SecF [Bacillota bacterium]|nr:protein translocase subunit SecF [Bacillota bacterium]